MRHNPCNGVLCVGSGNGVVSMWSPKVREPLAKMLCHSTPMSALAIDPKGVNMVTSGLDRTVKVWDIRNLNGPIDIYKLKMSANEIDVSQKGTLAFSMGKICEIYTNTVIEDKSTPYLRQRADDFIHGLRFCPYEDVLGISTSKGFSSILVPGSGEANFDALEANPFQTKSQRRENEVHALLEKIPPELITLDPNEIAEVDVNALKDKVEAKKQLLFLKPPEIDFKSRRKMKGKGGSVKAARNKQIVRGLARKAIASSKKELIEQLKVNESEDFIPLEPQQSSVLDRFKVKKKK